ncbi:MiaB/RimO family radical SAM methylthiotransferase [Candidatus Parcubacteria bacterium]|nr:MiaB/RimO family radical SAM methylthiotransferase [Candidatus Parcubacteria bacterium]
MNYSDSERIMAVLEDTGYKKTLSEDDADLIIINACSVRKSAVDRIAGNFKKYKKYKKKNPNLKIVLTGCVLESDKERFEKMFDLVVDIKEIKKLTERIKNCHCEGVATTEAIPELQFSELNNGIATLPSVARNDSSYFNINPYHQNEFSAYVPIMTGCNNFCSYCVVPYTRGREYSRPAEEVLNEVVRLIKKGYREIILLGQNVNSYKSQIQNHKLQINSQHKTGPPWAEKSQIQNSKQFDNLTIEQFDNRTIDFPNLLKLIDNIPGNFWIRFLTSHPKDMTEELIKTIVECEKVTPYIHLALQSGNNEILKKMNRKYTAKHFLNLIKLIKKHLPDAAISTDVIVGFPGETEKQFQNTIEVMKKVKFDMVYINKYSPRANTASYKMKDNISWKEKKKREKSLTEILKETALENNKKYIGKVIDVLIDKVDDDFIYGKTRSFKNVKITVGIKNQESGIKEGEFIEVKIIKAKFWNLEGEIVK